MGTAWEAAGAPWQGPEKVPELTYGSGTRSEKKEAYLLLRQAGRNRSILLRYRLSRLRKGQNITRIT